MDDRARIDLRGILRELEDDGGEVRVEFVPAAPGGSKYSGDNTALMSAVSEAVDVANGAEEGAGGGSGDLSLDGVSVKLKCWDDDRAVAHWLTVFARNLTQSGHPGLVRATPGIPTPRWVWFGQEPRATAYVCLDESLRRPSVAQLWCRRSAAWAARVDGTPVLYAGPRLQHDPSTEVAAHLEASIRGNGSGTLTFIDSDGRRATWVRAEEDGSAVLQSYDPARHWSAVIEDVRAAVVESADVTRLAFVAMTPSWAYGWEYRGRGLPPLPTVPSHFLRRNRTAWRRYVPDAHGIQLLTAEHLDRARDLSGWRVTAVRPDRYLVEAPDAASWFAPEGPGLDQVEQARADFGDLIVPAEAAEEG